MEHTKAYQEFKKNGNTKFVRYSEGAEMYHMSVSKFMQMAKDAKAIYKLGQLVLVNLKIFDEYIETFHIVDDEFYKQVKEQKLDELKQLKKEFLRKMFPAKGCDTPEIRFPGFTGAWEQRKLIDEVTSIDTGKSKFTPQKSGVYEILGSTSVIGYDDSYDYEGDFLLTARVGANAGELYRHSGKV